MNAKAGAEIIQLIERDDADGLKQLLESGVSPDSVVRLGRSGMPTFTLLECSTAKSAEAVMRLLIDAGANINGGKFKPLILATQNNDLEAARLLLDAGADPNVQWNDPYEKERGLTPLMYAVGFSGGLEMIELLVGRGADPNIQTDKGNSALSRATAYDNVAALNKMLESGCKPLGPVLPHPIHRGNAEQVERLIAAGADVNAIWQWKGETGRWNVLQGAVSFRGDNIKTLRSPLKAKRARFAEVKIEAAARFKIVRDLIRAGAKVNRADSPSPPLYLAAAEGDLETVQLLLEAGADPNPPGGNELGSPLHAACRGGFVEVAECLLKAGANANARSAQGLTALEEFRQLPKSKELENWERVVHEGGRVEPGAVEAMGEAWNRNRARLMELLAAA